MRSNPPVRFSSRPSRRLEGRWLRWGGTLLLLAGLWTAFKHFPTRPADDWNTIHGFELDSAQCRAMRQQRLTSPLTVPPDVAAGDGPVTVRQAAEKFKLELPLVCGANGLAAACGDTPVALGKGTLMLPLYRQVDGAGAPREVGTETGSEPEGDG